MTTKTQLTALFARFDSHREAERFVEELHKAGFNSDDIGMLARHDTDRSSVEEATAEGAFSGGVLGAMAGAVATGIIPGVGPVIATGALAAVLGGAATGGLLGALVGLGVSEADAARHERDFHEGSTIVVVQAAGRLLEAQAILNDLRHDTAGK